jgi:aspartokinase-like uncharacterized kinase
MKRKEPDGHKTYPHPVVVKLGGSLIDYVPALAPILKSSPRPVIIVPGGGPFADAIRLSGLSDSHAAHWMAVAAMDQYGWLIASHGIPTTDRIKLHERTSVFLPYLEMRHFDPLPHSWDVTSDTISAWIAGKLGLDLVLLKSVDGIEANGSILKQVSRNLETDVVDPHLLRFVIENKIRAVIINGMHPDRVAKCLAGEPVPGTRIGTIF